MIEQDYDDFQELMSHQQSWIACELGDNLSEALMEEMQSE
jgi:hypothetical protein